MTFSTISRTAPLARFTRRAALANSAHNIYSCTRCIMTKCRCRVSVRRSDGIFGTKSVNFLGLQSVFHPL